MSALEVPENVDVETGEILPPEGFRLPWEPMNREQAITVKGQINAYAIRLPMLVKEAKEGEAWKALDCANWTEFVDEHLAISMEYARLLLRGYDKLEGLSTASGVPVELFEIPERLLRQLDTPTMVGVGREVMAALPAETKPEVAASAIDAAVRAKVEEQKLEEAAQRGREKAAKDLAEAKARRDAAEKDAELGRLRQAEERRKRKDAEAAKAAKTSDDGAPLAASDEPGVHPPVAPGSNPHGAVSEPRTDTPAADTGTGQPAPHTGDEVDGGVVSSSAATPPSLELEAAAEREAIARDMVAARALLNRDPARVVELMTAEDAATWIDHKEDMAEWFHGFDAAMTERNQLRSV